MRNNRKALKDCEYAGNIVSVRTVEDCIRATRKYTQGAFRGKEKHPVQGAEFPSRVLTVYYEVYPSTEISWDMPASTAIDLLWGDVPIVHVLFKYDYRDNKASVNVEAGSAAVALLKKGIPGFTEALGKVMANGNGNK